MSAIREGGGIQNHITFITVEEFDADSSLRRIREITTRAVYLGAYNKFVEDPGKNRRSAVATSVSIAIKSRAYVCAGVGVL